MYILFATDAGSTPSCQTKKHFSEKTVVGDQCTTDIGCNKVSQVIQPSHLL
jgi:hypothetical protein